MDRTKPARDELINVGSSLEAAVSLGDRQRTQTLVAQIKNIYPRIVNISLASLDDKEYYEIEPYEFDFVQNMKIFVARLLFVAKYVLLSKCLQAI